MNGRVYDPLIGKFLSGDPFVQDPTNGQNYNRYSYVLNNPTNLTDPTGFCSEGKTEVTGSSICHDISSFQAGHVAQALGTQGTNLVTTTVFNPAGNEVAKGGQQLTDTGLNKRSAKNGADNSAIKLFNYNPNNDGDGWKRTNQVTEADRFINGMMNDEKDAKRISLVEMRKLKISQFDLIHIPSLGFGSDLVRAGLDKGGFTTATAMQLAGIIQNAAPGNWYAHSYGGVAYAEAVRTLSKEGVTIPAGNSVTFLAGANNRWVTNAIMRDANVTVKGYTGHWLDPVPNIVGLNTFNPIQIAADIFMSWHLFTDWSTHTYPPVK